MIAFQDPFGQLPQPASTFAGDVDEAFYFLFWVSAASFVLIVGALTYSAIVHRRKTADQPPASNVSHSTTLEVIWTLVPTAVVMIAFAWGLKGNLHQQIAPADALQYRAVASQWSWKFYHPGATTPSEFLYVPKDTPAKFVLTSTDVVHSFYVPAFRAKRDVVPGMRQLVWFEATQLNQPQVDAAGNPVGGGFDLFCAEYCGDAHSRMHTKVFVVTPEEYAEKPWNLVPETPEGRGEYWFGIYCKACHLVDGVNIGPEFRGLWMREGVLADGSEYTADEEYIRESIRQPSEKVVKSPPGKAYGAPGASGMTPFIEAMLSDEQIGDIIAWLKTLE